MHVFLFNHVLVFNLFHKRRGANGASNFNSQLTLKKANVYTLNNKLMNTAYMWYGKIVPNTEGHQSPFHEHGLT